MHINRLLRGSWVRAGLALAATAALSSCGTVYLHNAQDAKGMAEAQKSLASARENHDGAFADHEKYLAAAFKAERAALIGLELARRDLEVVSVLDKLSERHDSPGRAPAKPGLPEARAREALQELYNARLKAIEPGFATDAFDQPGGGALFDRLTDVNFTGVSLEHRSHVFTEELAKYQRLAPGHPVPRCTSQSGLAPQEPPPEISEPARNQFLALNDFCKDRESARAQLDAKRNFVDRDSPPVVAAWVAVVAGKTSRVAELGSGELKTAAGQVEQLRQLRAAQNVLVVNAEQHRSSLERYLRCLKDQAATPTLEHRIATAAQRLASFIQWLATLDEQQVLETKTATRVAPVAEEDCQLSSGGKVPQPALVRTVGELAAANSDDAGSRISIGEVQNLLVQLSGFKPTRSFVGSLQETAQRIRELHLYEILSALGQSSSEARPEDRTAAIAVSAVKLVSLIRDLDSGKLPSTSAVLIDLADAKMKADNAHVEAERLKKLTELAELRLTALRNEILILQTGIDQVTRNRAPELPTLLRSYTESWMRGRVQQTLIQNEMLNLEYVAWTRRQRTAAEATYAMLDPAFTELGVYADGGFKPEDIARYLGVLGLGAIAVGTN